MANLNNLNKENIITVDIKNASISTQGNMTFYITDIKTCNIYCQLVINRSKSNLIKKFAPIENAIDYKVILRAVDPNKSGIKELEFTLLNQIEAFFMVELTDEFISCAGDYKCELFVECKVNGVLERITTSPFTYKVNGSIIDELFKDDDNSGGGNSGGGVAPSLIENLATKQYVDEQITDIPNTDLLVTFTSRHIDDAISSYDDEIVAQDFASKEYVGNVINGIKQEIKDAGYTTESYVNKELIKLSTSIAQQGFVTESQMDSAIDIAIGELDFSDYATKSYVNEAINNKTSYYDMRYATTSYVDTEVDEVFNYCVSVRTILQNVIDEYADKNYVDTAIANAQLGGGEGGSIDTDNLVITNSLTVGDGCTASGKYSMAQGIGCNANTDYSHAEGYYTTASGEFGSHSEGERTTASGYRSHAEGWCTTASGTSAHAEGYKTIAASKYQHVQGKYNIEDTEDKYAHIVGNGTKDESNNAHTLDWSGNAWYQGDVYVGGTSQDDANKLATESYVDNAINNIEIPDVDLTDYATKEELNNVLNHIDSILRGI